VNNINDQLDATITILLIFESAQQLNQINKIVIVASSWSFILFTYTYCTRQNIVNYTANRVPICLYTVSWTFNCQLQ